MKALILAAGKGERMRPLTAHTPKPLLEVAGKPLIVWHLEKLAALGVRDVVVNTAWLAPRLVEALEDGARWSLRIAWAHEGAEPLETGGALLHARALLGEAPFIAVNGDIWTDFEFARLPQAPRGDAHLVLVDNPEHHPGGDFMLGPDGRITDAQGPRLTFAGIGVYRPELLDEWRETIGPAPGADQDPPRFKLAPLLRAAMRAGRVDGLHHRGRWTDVGTPQRLHDLDAQLRAAPAATGNAPLTP